MNIIETIEFDACKIRRLKQALNTNTNTNTNTKLQNYKITKLQNYKITKLQNYKYKFCSCCSDQTLVYHGNCQLGRRY